MCVQIMEDWLFQMLKTSLNKVCCCTFGVVSDVEETHFTFKSICGGLLEDGRGIWQLCRIRKWETGAQMKEENLQRAPEKWGPQPYSSFALSLTSPVMHTMSLSLSRWADMEPEDTEWSVIYWSFLLEVTCLLISSPHLLYLLWVYYSLFDSCCMFSEYFRV